MSTSTIQPGTTAYVVRNRQGRFVRAFLTRQQAEEFDAGNTYLAVVEEVASEPDQSGNIFPIYSTAERYYFSIYWDSRHGWVLDGFEGHGATLSDPSEEGVHTDALERILRSTLPILPGPNV